MSLLGTPVYANPTTPIWAGVSGNQSISGNLSVTGTFTSGGIITGPSVTPAALINASKTLNPVPASPTVTNITNDTAYPTVIGAIYDVSIKGRVLIASGTGAAGDLVTVIVNNGTNFPGNQWNYLVYPTAAGANGLFDIRTRIVCDTVMPSLTVGFTATLAGGSTGVYQGIVYSFNATRVK